MDTILESYFPRTNPKSRLFQKVKKVPTTGIPKISTPPIFGIPEIWTISTQVPISGIPFIQYIISIFQFVEFQKQALFSKFSICVFPGVLPIFEMDRFLELISTPIFEIPKIWKLHLYQYLAVRVKCEIVPWYLEIPNICHSVCFSSPTLQCIDPLIYKLECLFYRN